MSEHRKPQKNGQNTALSPKQKLTVACHYLANQGHCNSLAGQISFYDRTRDWVVTPPMNLLFNEMDQDNFLNVDGQFNAVNSSQKPNPATLFHLWIYRARPDVNCVIHTHPPHVSALSMLNIPLHVCHMDMCMFFNDIAHLNEWPGVPVANKEGEIISQALGTKRALLLANHGYLVACASIEEATYMAVMLEEAAKLQLLAMSAGQLSSIDKQLAKEAHDFLLQPAIVQATFDSYTRQLVRSEPGLLKPSGAGK